MFTSINLSRGIAAGVLIVIIGVVALFWVFLNVGGIGTGCTKELQICSNGRGVGRVGPNCEFAPCELPISIDECEAKTGFWKQWCYRDYAAEVALAPQFCHQINLVRVRDSCYYEISTKADAMAVCEELPKKFTDSCIVSVSKDSSAAELCERLSNKANQIEVGECYRNVAANRLDESLCDKIVGLQIGSFDYKYLCLRGIALERDDRGFCGKLESLGLREVFYSNDCQAAFRN